jgi:hypothetical protein
VNETETEKCCEFHWFSILAVERKELDQIMDLTEQEGSQRLIQSDSVRQQDLQVEFLRSSQLQLLSFPSKENQLQVLISLAWRKS